MLDEGPGTQARAFAVVNRIRLPHASQFLAEAAALDGLDLDRLQQPAQLYAAVGERWQQLADAVDPQCRAEERTAQFAALADRMEDIQSAEEAAAKSMSG